MMIEGQRVRLRAVERADIPTFLRWFSDPEVTQYLSIYLPISEAAEERWYDRLADDPNNLVFAVETLEGVHIGNVGLHRIDWKDRQAELGIALGEKAYWNQGYGRDAVRTLCRFGFHQLNLHRIYLHVFSYNERAQRCYAAVGFVAEGTLRQAHYTRGRYHDVHLMGLLRPEFDALESGASAGR